MIGAETEEHKRLKVLALQWAQASGYRIAAAEVSVPQFRMCIDVAAYKPVAWSVKKLKSSGELSAIGATAIFECKQSRTDFLKDCHEDRKVRPQLERIYERKALLDQELRRHFPSLRNGDSLFPEFETYRLGEAGYGPYDRLMSEIQLLSKRLHDKTKFDTLCRWRAANLFYVVGENGVAKVSELPFGWGLLEREGDSLALIAQPLLTEAPDENRLMLLQRIALVASRTKILRG